MNYDQCLERYHSDPHFKLAVDGMVNFVRESHFTPGELKDIANFAGIVFEQTHVRPNFMPRDTPRRG